MSWSKRRLGEFCEIKHGYAFKSKHFGDDGRYIVLTPGNFYDEGGFKSRGDKEKFYTIDPPEDYILQKDDLIIAMTEQAEGLLGSSALVPEDDRYLHNQRLGLVTELNEQGVDKKFLYYLLNTYRVRGQIRASATGVKVKHTAPKRILNVEAYLPPIDTQRRIAGILSAYDDLIATNNRRMALLEESIQRLYREWFVHLRFPGHERLKVVEGVPEGWEKAKLSEIALVNANSITKRNALEIIEYIDISSVSTGIVNQIQKIDFSEAPSRARRIVNHGDIIWSTVRPGRRAYSLILQPNPNTIASTGFAVLTAKEIPFTFLYYAVTTDRFVDYMTSIARGAAYPAVTGTDFEEVAIIVPPSALLDEFDQIAFPVASQIHNLKLQNVQLQQARDLLLPRLMNGDIAV